ncbi:hypothetical protein SAMN04488168_13221 [Bacillus sp. 491mf]|nr:MULTISPECIES: hypothetical protein [unclassified Bacillus (in: firmicutes)]SFD32273.1 hypothetical protein SAMN04488168_13221 [Bacillus sp. 491mf]
MENPKKIQNPVDNISPLFKVILLILATFSIIKFILNLINNKIDTFDYLILIGGIGCISLILTNTLKKRTNKK